MKKWLMKIGVLLLVVLTTACSQYDSQKTGEVKQSNNGAEDQLDKEKTEMTKQQEEVFRSYGLTDEEIDKMKKNGLSYKEQSFVDTAIMMLTYLEEKYDEKFQVVGGDIPGILSNEYWITAEACEGDYAGEKFNVYYLGNNMYEDGYITLLKQDEACETFKELVLSKFDNVLILPSFTGEYGKELSLDNTGEEMSKIVSYYCDYILIDPDMPEDEFMKISEDIENFLNDNDVFSSGSALYLNEAVDEDITSRGLSEILTADEDAIKWNYYISSR